MRDKLVWPVTLLVITGMILGFGYYVWPGQWVYSAYSTSSKSEFGSDSRTYPVRVNRFSSTTERWTPQGGWERR